MPRFVFLLCLSISILLVKPSSAQETYTLTLDDAIEMAREKSPAGRMARLDYESARWNHRAFEAGLLPSFSINANAPGFLRSLSSIDQDDGSLRYVQQRRTFYFMNLQMDQPILLTGGEVSLRTGLNFVDQSGGFGFSQWSSTPLNLAITQPLFGFNALKWQRRIEPIQFESTTREYIEEMATLSTTVADQFFAVYDAQRSIDIASFNVAVNDTIYTLSRGRFDIGTIAENELLQSELQLINAQTSLADAEIQYQEALQSLRIQLDLPYDSEVIVNPPLTAPDIVIDPDEAVRYARTNRPAYLNLVVQSLQAEQEVDQARKNQFGIDVSASYGLNQTSDSFDNVYADPLNRQQFSVAVNMPIFQWGQNRSRLKAALAEQERVAEERALTQQQLDQVVYFEALRFEMLKQRVAIAAQADDIANRRFEVARNRYTVGNIDITDLFNAQREKDTANRDYIQTLRQFWASYYNIRRLTLYDFEADQPLTF